MRLAMTIMTERKEKKMKTVGDLKKMLAPFNDNLPVAVYSQISEDMDEVHEVRLENEKLQSYCKGDHVLSWHPEITQIVVVR